MNLATDDIRNHFNHLFNVERSLTGPGNEYTLDYLNNHGAKIDKRYVRSGSTVFDWNVPPEWSVNEAYILNGSGEKIIDYANNFLHLVNYSVPIRKTNMTLEQIKPHIHYSEKDPNVIPYRTTYYDRDWGFCCTRKLLESEKFHPPFTVVIDTNLDETGNMVWGERIFEGQKQEEIVLTTYICHPNLANDNLSGIITNYLLMKFIETLPNLKYTYRFAFFPETIGALVFLKQHPDIEKIKGGSIVTNTAGPGRFKLKQSFDPNHYTNQALQYSCQKILGNDIEIAEFTPDGSDERQFSKPGFRINTPSLHKSKYYDFWQYHTSADDLSIIDIDGLLKVFECYQEWILLLESFVTPKFTQQNGEMQLGKRGLYPSIGGGLNQNMTVDRELEIIMWMMHYFDGTMSNFDLATKINVSIYDVNQIIQKLYSKNILIL